MVILSRAFVHSFPKIKSLKRVKNFPDYRKIKFRFHKLSCHYISETSSSDISQKSIVTFFRFIRCAEMYYRSDQHSLDVGKTKNIVPSAYYVPRRKVISNMTSSLDTSQYAISKFCPRLKEGFYRMLLEIYNFRNCSS